MKKLLLNGALISAMFEVLTTYYTTKHSPRNWRTPLLWLTTIITCALAIGSLIEESSKHNTK